MHPLWERSVLHLLGLEILLYEAVSLSSFKAQNL